MAQLISWLKYVGARDVDGDPVDSGAAYFYQPGTTNTRVAVFSDADGLVVQSQPVTLDAGGRASVWVSGACRIEIQDSDGEVIAVGDRGNTVAAGAVEIENAGFTGTSLTTGQQVAGGRTDLNTALTSATTSVNGTDFKYKEAGGTSSRDLHKAIGRWVTPQDFGALANDLNDDTTAVQAAITRAMAANKGVWLEPGTYRITAALTVTGATGAGIIIAGADRANCIIKNMSTSGNALTVDLSSAIESHIVLRNFSVTANTTSSGSAITITNGSGVLFERVNVALHRIGYDTSAVSHSYLEDCLVTSTDSNSACKGFKLGAHATASKCRVTAATAGKGFSAEGQYAEIRSCRVIASTTAFDVAAADVAIYDSFSSSATTGFNIGAYARAAVIGCRGSSNTTDLTVNSSATILAEHNNNFTTYSNTGATPGNMARRLTRQTTVSSASGTPTYTPSNTPNSINVFESSAAAGATATLANIASTAAWQPGDELHIVLVRDAAANNLTFTTIGTIYDDAATLALATNFVTVQAKTQVHVFFRWTGAAMELISLSAGATIT